MFFHGSLILVIVSIAFRLAECGIVRAVPTSLELLQGRFDKRRYEKGPGVSYSPFQAKNACKTPNVIANEVGRLRGVSMIRLYGGECDQIRLVLNAAKAINAKIMIGVWDIGKIDEELNQIVHDVGSDWEHVDTLVVGNELINNLIGQNADKARKQAEANAIVSALKKARAKIQEAKWKDVPIVTVDTWIAIRDYPILCENSDYIAANAHTYFDGNVKARDSGRFIQETVSQVLFNIGSCKGKYIRITETGWPSAGNPNNQAQAGPVQQKAAVESIVKSTKGNVIILSAYDETWKDNGPFNIEKFWGINKIFQDVLKAVN